MRAVVGTAYLRDHEIAVQQVADVYHGVTEHLFVGHLHGEGIEGHRLQVSESSLCLHLLLVLVDAQGESQDDEGEDDAEHTHGIGDGVARGDGGRIDVAQVTVCLLRSSQSWCVGDGSRKNARHGGDARARKREDAQGHHDAQGNDDDAEKIEALAAVLERGEEAGTHLQTDAVDEENQSELLQEMEQVTVEVERIMAEDETDEENPRQTERHSLHPQLAQTKTQRDDQRKDHHRVGDSASPQVGEAIE